MARHNIRRIYKSDSRMCNFSILRIIFVFGVQFRVRLVDSPGTFEC